MTLTPPRRPSQVRALATAFLARFFENEITAGSRDLRNSFFWLIAFLATPGFLAPVFMMWHWNLVGTVYGPEALRLTSRADKVLYLGFSVAATGVLAAIIWHSLLVDRRDARVLGTLPVDGRVIVRAKLRALVIYASIVAAAMHALSSLTFGFMLAAGSGLLFTLRGIVAHFVAASLASTFTLCAVAAVQGSLLALLGPRRFSRLSPLLQLGLVTSIMLGLLSLTTISLALNDTLAGEGRRVLPWVLQTPPAWFLGLYESILGTDDPALLRLGGTALAALGLVAAGTWFSYPLAYRRVMVAAVEEAEGVSRQRRLTRLARTVTARISRRPAVRAAGQFLLATIGRAERHRFLMATTLGLAAAFSIPSLLQWRRVADALPEEPPVPMLVLPVAVMIFLLAGFRVCIAVPADLRASWLFAVASPAASDTRMALRRLMVAFGVAPPVVVLMPFYARFWGWPLAGTHALLAFAAGLVVTEALLSRQSGMPCSTPWRPERARLRSLWPAYVAAFAITTQGVAALSTRLDDRPAWLAATVAGLGLLAWAIRIAGSRAAVAVEEEDEGTRLQVLGIE